MPRQLIVNADDFGLTKGVSEGILTAHERGIVTTTTVMMNQPYTKQALELSRSYPQLEVGVHLVFNKSYPILPSDKISSLIQTDGRFYKDIYAHREIIDEQELYSEFCAQIELFIEITGYKPGHLDCHHWAVLHPTFFSVYLSAAGRYDVPVRVPFPEIENFEEGVLQQLFGNVPTLGLAERLESLTQLLQESEIAHPHHFRAGFFGGQATLDYVLRLIEQLPEGTTELMTHPGFVDDDLCETSSYQKERRQELEVLTNPLVIQFLLEQGIELVDFRSIRNCEVRGNHV